MNHLNLKKRAMQLAAVLLSLAVLLPSVPAAFASQSAAEGTAVVFSESGITAADESGLSIDGTTLTIEQAGTYVLSGTCSDGSVKVKKGVTGVTLVLSGLDLTSSTTAPITCGKSSGVTILAAEGTENALTDAAANNGDNYPDNADAENAVIKCKDGSQVTIGGTGTLTVTANGKNGIKSGATTDEEGTAWLVIEDLTLTINAPVNDAVNAEASLTVKSGTITIDAGDDALHADYALAIGESGTAGPTITINSCYEGLAGANLLVASGAITIYSEDDCLNAANSDLTGYDFTMGITGGTIRAYAASDDGLDSNGSLTISGGTLTVWTANTADNQALDADGTITVSGGTVFAAGGSAGMGMTLSASQPYVTFGTQASQPGQGGRQQNGGNAPGGQQDGSTPPSMPDGQSGSQPQQPGGAQTTGTQQTPPNMVLVGMALFLTLFTMAPVVTQIQTEAYEPYKQEEISQEEFLDRAQVPLKEFMLRNTKTSTLNMFCDLAKVELPENVNMEEAVKLPLRVVVPSFMTCELQRAFEIGLLLYIPFMLIDIVVSSTLMSMGMIMLPPSMISMPFKLLLFVTVNGWELLFSSLVQSFK